jgi:hypothetical protein
MSNMTIEGEPLRRYKLSYGGSSVGSCDTAGEVLMEYESHDKLIRPVVDPQAAPSPQKAAAPINATSDPTFATKSARG